MSTYSVSKAVKKAETDVVDHLEYATKRFMQHMNDPNATQEDADELWKEITEKHGKIGKDVLEAARDEMEEKSIGLYQTRGLSREQAEKHFKQKWKEVFDSAEKMRDLAEIKVPQKSINALKFVWLKAVAAVCATVGLAAVAYFVAIQPGLESGRALQQDIGQKNRDFALHNSEMSLQVSQSRFDSIAQDLVNIPSVSVPQPAIADTAVAAMASTPVTVAIAQPNEPEKMVQTTIGRVYQVIPESRRQIQSWTRESNLKFKSWTVNAGFSSISVRCP